jgi:hypothetical protein
VDLLTELLKLNKMIKYIYWLIFRRKAKNKSPKYKATPPPPRKTFSQKLEERMEQERESKILNKIK